MTIIQIDPIGTTSLLCLTSTLDDTVHDQDARSTTLTGLSTTLASSSVTQGQVQMNYASRYIESLSDEQLAEMEQRLVYKEEIMNITEQKEVENQQLKVLQKTRKV